MASKSELSKKRKLELNSLGYSTSMAPFGYRSIHKEINRSYRKNHLPIFVLHPIEEKIVKEIFDLFVIHKKSLIEIDYIIRSKHAKDFKLKSKNGVRSIITRKFYCGYMIYLGKEYRHAYPTIIDEDIFNEAQKLLKTFIHTPKRLKIATKKKQLKKILPWQEYLLNSGRIYYSPPFGYYKKLHGENKEIVIDADKKQIIQEVFRSYVNGEQSQLTLPDHIYKKFGLRKSRGFFADILKNKFYCGIIEYNGKEYPHIYPTIVNRNMLEAAQNVADRNISGKLHKVEIKKFDTTTEITTFIKLPDGQFSLEDLIANNPQTTTEIRKELMRLWKNGLIREVTINVWEKTR